MPYSHPIGLNSSLIASFGEVIITNGRTYPM